MSIDALLAELEAGLESIIDMNGDSEIADGFERAVEIINKHMAGKGAGSCRANG